MRGVRLFEIFVALLVLAVVVCFCIELSLISVPDVGQLFRGYLPSDALIQPKGYV
jgi:metal iron transporter